MSDWVCRPTGWPILDGVSLLAYRLVGDAYAHEGEVSETGIFRAE